MLQWGHQSRLPPPIAEDANITATKTAVLTSKALEEEGFFECPICAVLRSGDSRIVPSFNNYQDFFAHLVHAKHIDATIVELSGGKVWFAADWRCFCGKTVNTTVARHLHTELGLTRNEVNVDDVLAHWLESVMQVNDHERETDV